MSIKRRSYFKRNKKYTSFNFKPKLRVNQIKINSEYQCLYTLDYNDALA